MMNSRLIKSRRKERLGLPAKRIFHTSVKYPGYSGSEKSEPAAGRRLNSQAGRPRYGWSEAIEAIY